MKRALSSHATRPWACDQEPLHRTARPRSCGHQERPPHTGSPTMRPLQSKVIYPKSRVLSEEALTLICDTPRPYKYYIFASFHKRGQRGSKIGREKTLDVSREIKSRRALPFEDLLLFHPSFPFLVLVVCWGDVIPSVFIREVFSEPPLIFRFIFNRSTYDCFDGFV